MSIETYCLPDKQLFFVRLFTKDELNSITSIYGKADLTAPEGYEFTGEFREPKDSEVILTGSGHGKAEKPYTVYHGVNFEGEPRLILRKIEEKEVERGHCSGPLPEQLELPLDTISDLLAKQAAKSIQEQWDKTRGYTAADILARYGQNVLDVFGYREGTLRDYPGFVYSGELTNVNPGEWYVYAGQVRKYENLNKSVFSSLTLIPTAPPEPRIVTFTWTADQDFDFDEARYIMDDQGGFMTYNGNDGYRPFSYKREEVE